MSQPRDEAGREAGGRLSNAALPVVQTLRLHFVTGLRVLTPFVITYVVIRFLYNFAAGVFQPVFVDWFGHRIPGLGFAILFLTPFVVGAIALWVFGGRPILTVEAWVARIPVIGPVFTTARQFVAAFGGTAETGFRHVVEVEYPRPGVWSLGFLTDHLEHEDDSRVAVVYIPTSPTPNTGYLALVPVEDVRRTDLSIGDAMRMLVSVGAASPSRITRQPGVQSERGEIQ